MSAPATTLSKPVADRPPAPTAPAVLALGAAKQRELAELVAHIGAAAYLAATKVKTGAALLAELREKIEATRFEIEANSAAHAYAIEVDKATVADWWTQIRALPAEEAIAGISKTECCNRCSEAGCVITGDACAHPQKLGANLPPRLAGNPAIRRLHKAAAQKLGVYR